MPTSGTSIFNLDLNNLIEEAFERCGSELRSGYDLRTARRTLNLLTIEWANRVDCLARNQRNCALLNCPEVDPPVGPFDG